MADSQVAQYRRENEQKFGGYFSAEDLDACFEPDEEPTEPHASDCNVWVNEPCSCVTGKPEVEL